MRPPGAKSPLAPPPPARFRLRLEGSLKEAAMHGFWAGVFTVIGVEIILAAAFFLYVVFEIVPYLDEKGNVTETKRRP